MYYNYQTLKFINAQFESLGFGYSNFFKVGEEGGDADARVKKVAELFDCLSQGANNVNSPSGDKRSRDSGVDSESKRMKIG